MSSSERIAWAYVSSLAIVRNQIQSAFLDVDTGGGARAGPPVCDERLDDRERRLAIEVRRIFDHEAAASGAVGQCHRDGAGVSVKLECATALAKGTVRHEVPQLPSYHHQVVERLLVRRIGDFEYRFEFLRPLLFSERGHLVAGDRCGGGTCVTWGAPSPRRSTGAQHMGARVSGMKLYPSWFVVPATLLALVGCTAAPSSGPDAPDARPDADSAPPPADLPANQVQTDTGVVVGQSDGTITAFLGVPYAAPPLGQLRWRPPQPHAAWSEPFEATALGPACAQSEGGLGQNGPFSEDCLTVNVWTPRTGAAAKAPVMVFIHGGFFVHGSSNQDTYDGRALAVQGVVMVSMNYRLGALGFLAHPALTAEDEHASSGNTALLDQAAALRWVQTNIAAFGGDPSNVTVFGESAGAMTICALVVSPLGRGLFHRAIGESGSCAIFTTPLHATTASAGAESLGVAVAAALGCDTAPDVLACMRGKPAAEVIAAAPMSLNGVSLQPNIDGYVLPEAPSAALAAGRVNPLDGIIGGTNQDEATLFTQALVIDTEAQYQAAVTLLLPSFAADALALYPAAAFPTPKDAYNTLFTDVIFVCPTRGQLRGIAARGTSAYLYQLTRPTRFGETTGLGVYHGSELPFVFGNLSLSSGMSAADRAFSNQVIGYWTRFAATGDPNGTSATPWPPHTAASDTYLDLGTQIAAANGLRRETCDAIAQWRAP
jgi:para-nitrobenzyl esterase